MKQYCRYCSKAIQVDEGFIHCRAKDETRMGDLLRVTIHKHDGDYSIEEVWMNEITLPIAEMLNDKSLEFMEVREE